MTNAHFQALLSNAVSTGSKQVLTMPDEYLKLSARETRKTHSMRTGSKLAKLHLLGADIRYISEFYSFEKSEEIFNKLLSSLATADCWDRFGKGRFVAQWSNPPNMRYIFSEVEYIAQAFPNWIEKIRQEIMHLLIPIYGKERCDFNYCVANCYMDGSAGVNWHTDSEAHIVPQCPIACVSFGAERVFSLARIFHSSSENINIRLQSGSVIVMAGDCQANYLHAILKDEEAKLGKRFSLTFRVNYR